MNFGTIWGITKIAAKHIPWARLAQHAPELLERLGPAREKRKLPRDGVEERLAALAEENERLAQALVETTEQLHAVAQTLRTVSSRQFLVGSVAAVSLLVALAALVLALQAG